MRAKKCESEIERRFGSSRKTGEKPVTGPFIKGSIPYMEQRVVCLCLLASMEMDAATTHLMTDEQKRAREDMLSAIISDPCVARYDFR